MSSALFRRGLSLAAVCGVLFVGSLSSFVFSDDEETDTGARLPGAIGGGIPTREKSNDVNPPTSSFNDSESDDAKSDPALQAVGGLGIGHIQSTLGLIGVTADAFAKDTYDAKKVDDLMSGTINGIEAVKKLLRRLQDEKLSDSDEEFIDRMIVTYNALQREAKALSTFVKSKKPSDGEAFEKARIQAIKKLNQLTLDDEEGGVSQSSASGK
jgi:hypothetical protein